jgi:hypothetical protein
LQANSEDAQSQSFTVVATDVAGNASEQVVSVAINNLDELRQASHQVIQRQL